MFDFTFNKPNKRRAKQAKKAQVGNADRQSSSHHGDIMAEVSSVNEVITVVSTGRLEELKRREAELKELLDVLRKERMKEIQSSPLTIGIVGFGTFGQFLSKTFVKYGKVVGTSRSDYTQVATVIGASYVPLSEPNRFLEQVDVVLFAVAIKSFQATVEQLKPFIKIDMERRLAKGRQGILFVDVCSVKEYPRKVMLDLRKFHIEFVVEIWLACSSLILYTILTPYTVSRYLMQYLLRLIFCAATPCLVQCLERTAGLISDSFMKRLV